MKYYKDDKQAYKDAFTRKYPFLTKDVKLAGSIARFCEAIDTNNKYYLAIEERSRMRPDGTSGFLTMQDFAKFLTQINAYNDIIMCVMAEIMEVVPLVTMKVKQVAPCETQREGGQELMVGDIEPKLFIPGILAPNPEVVVTNKQFRESPKLREFFANGHIEMVEIVREEWEGNVSDTALKNVVDYLRAVNATYEKYKDKPFKMFEFNLAISTEPAISWRSVTDSTFRVELQLGKVFLPAPREYINDANINKHFSHTESIAFAYVHEFKSSILGHKLWVVDEFQSDIVEHIHLLSTTPETKTWYNPKGKSKNERFKTKTDNYYKDWHKVLFSILIEKAKELGVEELWLITGKSIYSHWHSKHGFGNASSDIELEKTMRLFRRYYDNMALEYTKFMDPKFKAGADDYAELLKKINSFHDSWDKIEMFRTLTMDKNLTEEQRAKKLAGLDPTEAMKMVAGTDFRKLKARMEEVLCKEASVVRRGEFPGAVYEGDYHVIDLTKVP